MVVEDDAILALVTAEMILSFGHEVVGPAYYADDALELPKENSPSLALVDINLAGHDEGIALAQALGRHLGTRSIFISGQVAVARETRSAALGLLPKPYKLQDFEQSIEFAHGLLTGQNPLPSSAPIAFEVFTQESSGKQAYQ